MNVGEQLLNALASYGVPILAATLYVGCMGLPLPNALLLIAAGSFIAGGQLSLWLVIAVSISASIAGDLSGYAIGRWLGPKALQRVSPKYRARIEKAELAVCKRGAWTVFLTRWLLTPLGPWVNLISGASEYSFPRFLAWDVLGEAIWVFLYVSIGRAIAGEVQAISAIAGDITWLFLAFAVVLVLAWRVFRTRRSNFSR
jgi:membrane protein DedA with SNARE-associated domain